MLAMHSRTDFVYNKKSGQLFSTEQKMDIYENLIVWKHFLH